MSTMGVTEILGLSVAIVGALATVVVKLYRDRVAADRSHKRDLRNVAGLPTSLEPRRPDSEPPPTVPSRRRR